MKCSNCNYESEEEFNFCQNCGKKVENTVTPNSDIVQSEFSKKPQVFKTPAYLKGGLFMTVCILTTVGTALNLISGSFSVLNILFSIFLWLVYSSAHSNNPLYAQHMRLISGTIFARYVINWVIFGLLIFCCIILTIVLAIGGLSYLPENAFSGTLYNNGVTEEVFDILETVFQLGISSVILILIIVMLLAALAIALFNVFGIGSIHTFAKSLYLYESGATKRILNPKAAKSWILVFGILNAVSALSSISNKSLLAYGIGCIAAAYIVAFALLNKYFQSSKRISAR